MCELLAQTHIEGLRVSNRRRQFSVTLPSLAYTMHKKEFLAFPWSPVCQPVCECVRVLQRLSVGVGNLPAARFSATGCSSPDRVRRRVDCNAPEPIPNKYVWLTILRIYYMCRMLFDHLPHSLIMTLAKNSSRAQGWHHDQKEMIVFMDNFKSFNMSFLYLYIFEDHSTTGHCMMPLVIIRYINIRIYLLAMFHTTRLALRFFLYIGNLKNSFRFTLLFEYIHML